MAFKLGLKAPRPGSVRLSFATYLNFNQLPTPPAVFGHYSLVGAWGMLGNDQWGDCADAGPCHQTMLWTAEGTGAAAPFSTASALQNYTQTSDFDPNAGPPGNNPTDQGTDIAKMAAYWANTGFVDDTGARHKVVAVMNLHPGDVREILIATYLFGSVGLGFALPDSAMQQTQNGEPWDVVPDANIEGGHYVPVVGREANGNMVGITWGQTQEITPAFLRAYNNQGIVCLSEEMMINAKSIDGFDDQLLRADIAKL